MEDLKCPVCGAPEVGTGGVFGGGRLNIRGNKVYDKFGGWSMCLLNHPDLNIDGVDKDAGQLWFLSDPRPQYEDLVLIEVDGKLFTWKEEATA